MTILKKVIQRYFSLVLFILPYKAVLTFGSAIKSLSVTIQIKAAEQYFPVALFIFFVQSGSNI